MNASPLNLIPNIDDFAPASKLADVRSEQRIIAALMGNHSVASRQVASLTAEDFSSEQWRHMFTAIRSLSAQGTPIDVSTVEYELKRRGRYESVGGDMTVATVGLQYDEDISHLRDIVIQLSVRRQAISQFNKFVSQLESDKVNVDDVLKEAIEQTTFFAEQYTPQSVNDKMKELSALLLVTERPEFTPPLVTIDQTPIVRKGDHTLVIGKKKSRKSLFLSHLVSEYLRTHPDGPKKVVVFDTEQDRDDVWLARERIRKATSHTIDFANMRGMHPKERRDFISWTVRHRPLDLIVIDGIRDCMSNILDVDETTEVVVWLEEMTVKQRLAVINVLHTNKTDGNVRGHIGSELTNKAIATIELELDPKSGHSIAKCESSRKAPFEPFAFTHSADGQFIDLGRPEAPQDKRGTPMLTPSQKDQRLEAAFEGQLLRYAELKRAISNEFGIGLRKAEVIIAEFVRQGVIVKSGKQGDPKTTYKLAGSAAQLPPEPQEMPVEPSPAPLFDPPTAEPLPDGHVPTEDLPF